jgi:uncharacterized membrane protein YhaH (DUF805 family)
MTHRDFLYRLAGTLAAGLLLAGAMRLGLGARWFDFYGWATVLLATAVAVTVLLWRRLPLVGASRWWSLLAGVPAVVGAVIQIGFWVMFFRTGGSNPTLGVAREMVLPTLDAALPFIIAIWLAISAGLITKAGRPGAGA